MIKTAAEDLMDQGEQRVIPMVRECLIEILQMRFGNLPEKVRQEIEAVTSRDQLGSIIQQAKTVSNLDDLQLGSR